VVVEVIEVQIEDFNVDEVIGRVKSERMGAIVTFVGVVRNHSRGRKVDRIEIQVYEEMARKQLEEIKKEALNKFSVDEIAIIHRYGTLKVSEKIMMIAVGSSHRSEAFETCRWVLESIKKKVPIWKKEITPEGDFWVEEGTP
jgi:molybdopterin synthase catalytic subunit